MPSSCFVTIASIALAAAVGAASADPGLISKRFGFRQGVILEIGAATEDGARIDNVRFNVPTKVRGQISRVGGLFSAEIAISNTSSSSVRAGIAIALFDSQGQLVGAAGGGSKLGVIKPGRQKSFTLVFDGVNAAAGNADEFVISVETRR